MAEPTGNITGEGGGVSSWLTPDLISNLIQFAPALLQRSTARDQAKEAEKMQKALGPRVNYTIPESAKRALGVAEDLARPREMAGQNLMQYMLEQERSKTLAQAMRGLSSPQDVAALAAQQAEIGQAGQLQLGAAAAQDYNTRQQALGTALGTMAGYEDMVTADKQIDWYERANAAEKMKGAAMRNRMLALQGLVQSGTQLLGSDAASQLFNRIGAKGRSRRQTLGRIDEMGALSSDDEEGVVNPAGYVAPGMTDKQMLDVTGLAPEPLSYSDPRIPLKSLFSNSIPQLPINRTGLMSRQDIVNMPMFSTSNYGNITGDLPGAQVPPSTNPYQMGVYGQTPSSIGSLFNLFNTFY
jgi:hypothetical protein